MGNLLNTVRRYDNNLNRHLANKDAREALATLAELGADLAQELGNDHPVVEAIWYGHQVGSSRLTGVDRAAYLVALVEFLRAYLGRRKAGGNALEVSMEHPEDVRAIDPNSDIPVVELPAYSSIDGFTEALRLSSYLHSAEICREAAPIIARHSGGLHPWRLVGLKLPKIHGHRIDAVWPEGGKGEITPIGRWR